MKFTLEKKKFQSSLLGIILLMSSQMLLTTKVRGNTDKYRLTYRDDPSTTIVVGFNIINGSNQTVHYGPTDQGTNTNAYPFSRTVDHSVNYRGMNNAFVRISGLTPKTRYYFVVADDNSVSQVFYFETVTDDMNDTVSFISGGDSRQSSGAPDISIEWANEIVRKLKPDAVLFGGDMTNNGTDGEWQDWFDKWQLTNGADGRLTPIVAAQGNHESGPSMLINLFDCPDQDAALSGNWVYYGLTFGGNLIRTYTLNSDEQAIISDQANWLQADFAANSNVIWKSAQYHQPIAPHKSSKPYRTDLYSSWAQLFYDNEVRLVIECDAHIVKETEPVRPTGNSGDANQGFEIDPNGTVYAGEGTWRALRSVDVNYSFTKASGSFNQVKWIIVTKDKIRMRTIKTANAASVSEVSSSNRFTPPAGLDVWNNDVTEICPVGPPGPLLDILNPVDGSVYPTPQTITLVADANDIDGTVTQVDFYVNNNLVGTQFGAPYYMDFNFSTEGVYEIRVEATDNDGQKSTETSTITIGNPPHEIEIPVTQTSDDAEEGAMGGMDLLSSDLEMVQESTTQKIGIRFLGVDLPADATIVEAHIVFTVDEANSEATTLNIYGEKNTNPVTFSGVDRVSTRTKTNTSVAWTPGPWSSLGTKENSADLAPVINELISDPGYVQGNSMVFIIQGSGKRVAESSKGGVSVAPKLYIKYTSPSQQIVAPSCILNEQFTTAATLFALSTFDSFTFQNENGNLKITSTGHDEWANIDYAFNNGSSAHTIDLTTSGPPILKFRAKATSPCLINATLIANNIKAQNTALQGINELELDTMYRIIEINFDGHLWDEWVNIGANLDQTVISTISFSVNPGYVSYPRTGPSGTTYNTQFIGEIEIDWIRFGSGCEDCFNIPNGIGETDNCGACMLQTDPSFNSCVTSVDEEKILNADLARPNLFSESTTLFTDNLGTGPFDVKVVDLNGKVLLGATLSPGDQLEFGGSFPPGIFNVMVADDKHLWFGKVVKRE